MSTDDMLNTARFELFFTDIKTALNSLVTERDSDVNLEMLSSDLLAYVAI